MEHSTDTSLQKALARLGLSVVLPKVEIEQLDEALNNPAWSERLAAMQTLRKMEGRAPLELALRGITDEHNDVRAVAAYVLGAIGERTPPEALIVALRDPDWHVRAASAQALGKLGERIPVDALIQALDDEDESVRAAAVSSLSRAEDVPGSPFLTAAYDRSWLVREAAALALDELGEQGHVTQLIAARADEGASIRPGLNDRGYNRRQKKRRSFSRFVESSVAVLVILALIISWLALAHIPRNTSVGQVKKPTPLIYHSYTGGIYGGVLKIAWSADGTRIASINVDGSLRVWNANTGQTLGSYTSPVGFVNVLSMVWLPGNIVLVLSERVDNIIDAWNAISGREYMSIRLPTNIYTGAWSPDGSRIAFDDGTHEIEVWNVSLKKKISTYPVHSTDRITALAWSSDGKQIVSATYSGTIQIWDAATGKNVLTPYTNAGLVVSLAWSRDQSHIAWATSDGLVQVWNENHKSRPIVLRSADGSVMPLVALCWSPNGMYLAAGYMGLVQVWNTTADKKVFTYSGHTNGVNNLAWSPGGENIASASLDGTVQVWQIA